MSKNNLVERQKTKDKRRNPKVVKWEYVTEPEDEFVLETDIRRIHSPLKPSLSRGCCGALYLHLRSCVQGLSEKGKPVKTLYCTRDGRFFVRGKEGWNEILPNTASGKKGHSDHRGTTGCPRMRDYGAKPAHRCVAFAWCNPPKEVIEQVSDDNLGVPNANQQSVCGGEEPGSPQKALLSHGVSEPGSPQKALLSHGVSEPRHTSPLCRPAASDATMLPKAWEVDHLNTDHKNWTADNLQWVTADENRRRSKIARQLRKAAIDPKILTPTLCRGIYTLPEERIGELIERFKMCCVADDGELSVENIRINVAMALDSIRSTIKDN